MRPNRIDRDEHVPVFGDRRSPNCVEDWLEINDFECESAPVDSPLKFNKSSVPLPQKNTLTIQTRFLQRENSFRSSGGSSGRTVKSIIESFSRSNFNNERETSKHFPTIPIHNKPLRPPPRSAFVSACDKNAKTMNFDRKPAPLTPRVTSTIPKINVPSSQDTLPVTSTSVLAGLKPARRKKRQAPRAEDIYTNAKEKQQIIQTLSNMDLQSFDDNYDVVIDSFSLDGEFV